jgi:uncharacterized membrane protein
MAKTYVNQFGRRQSRGVRPWLLLPKVLAVGVYLGGLAAALVLWVSSGFGAMDASDPRRLWVIAQVGRLIEFMVVPALLCAVGLGVALMMQHPRQFVRMRWLLVKLISLAALIPAAHFFCSSRLGMLRQAFEQHTKNDGAARQLTWGLGLTLAASVWIVVLGRLKPRLGQNWARTYAATIGVDRRGDDGPGR